MSDIDARANASAAHLRHEQPLKTRSGWRVETSVDQYCPNCGKHWTTVIPQKFTTKAPPTEEAVTKGATREYGCRVYCCPDCRGFSDSALATHFPKGFLAAAEDAIREGPRRKLLEGALVGCGAIFIFVVSLIGISSTGSAVLLGFVGVLIAVGFVLWAFYSAFQSLRAKISSPKLKAAVANLSEKDAEEVFNRAKDIAWTNRMNRSSHPDDCWCLRDSLLEEAETELKKSLT